MQEIGSTPGRPPATATIVDRRGRLLLAGLAGALLAAALAVALLALPEILRRVVVWRVAGFTERPVTLAALEFDLFAGRLALRGLRVADHDGEVLAALERLEARFSPRELLGGHLRVTEATVEAPRLRLVRTGPHEFNISDLLRREARGPVRLPATVERLRVTGGTVLLEDRTLAPARLWRVEAVTLQARDVSTRAGAAPGIVSASALVAGSRLTVWMTEVGLSPLRFHATVVAREVDVTPVALYLPPGSPLTPAGGRLDASGTIVHEPGAGTRIALDAAVGGLELRRPGQESPYLSAPAVRVRVEGLQVGGGRVRLGRLAIDGGGAVLEDTRLGTARRWQAEGLALDVRNVSSARDAPGGTGAIRAVIAGAPVSVWLADLRLAPLELHATAILRDLDLGLLRLYAAAGWPLRPERGVVNASVRVDHDARRGTRLALDAGLTGLELHRPPHVLTAPAMRLSAEDIVLGAGAVRVGHTVLRSARLTIQARAPAAPRSWTVQDLAMEARDLSSRREEVQGIATARATIAGATVAAWITHARLDPLELRATGILRGLDLGLVQLALPAAVPVQLDRGVVDASVQVDHDLAEGTRVAGDVTLSGLQARGRGAAAGVSLASPSLRVVVTDARRRGQDLEVGRLELTGSAALTDGRAVAARADVEQIRLALEGLTWPIRGPARVAARARLRDGGELDVQGTALLTTPPPSPGWAAELAVRLTAVDLAPVAAYVPAAGGLAGRATASLTVTLAHGASLAARVQGDVSLASPALGHGGPPWLAARRLEATGLDILWPEQVTLPRLRLDRPRAVIERDARGSIVLPPPLAPPAADAPPAAPGQGPRPAIAVEELTVERGSLAVLEARDGARARFDVPRIDLTLREARWPASGPARLDLAAELAGGGTFRAEGTIGAPPPAVDLTLRLADGDLAWLQPYLPFRAGVRGRVDARLAVAGPLSPAPRLRARGEAVVKSLVLSDGQRPLLTLERLVATGIDATWPERLAVGKVEARRSWALIERTRDGRFALREAFQRLPRPATSPAPPAPPAPAGGGFEFRLGQAVVEDGAATIVDGATAPAARLEIAGGRLAVQDLGWPAAGPVKLQVTAPTPGGGRLEVAGTMTLDPLRLDARALLEEVELAPAQPYLPIEARVTGRATGDLKVTIGLEPLAVRVAGDARLHRVRLSDGDRPVATLGQVEAAGIDVEWPARVSVAVLTLRRPNLLIERQTEKGLRLVRLLTPTWPGSGPAAPRSARTMAADSGSAAPAASAADPASRPVIEVATLAVERASARFVDRTTAPPVTLELSEIEVGGRGLTTAPGRRSSFTGQGRLGGGARFEVQGHATAGARPDLELKLDLRDFPLARANPYLARFTSWTATRGTVTAAATYSLAGSRLDARHDLRLRQLEVARADDRDEVQERLGLPLGFLVSLLKDARGEIRLAVPVSGDLGTGEFDFQEAVWGAVRVLAIRLLALPFSRVGSLFFSPDSRLEAVTIAPVRFEPGTTRLAAGMTAHLDQVARLLRSAPALGVRLAPILTRADLDALKRERVMARLGARPGVTSAEVLEAARRAYRDRWPERAEPVTLEAIVTELAAAEEAPPEASRDLGRQRVDVVRQALTARGIDGARLKGPPRRPLLVEAAGAARVELDLEP